MNGFLKAVLVFMVAGVALVSCINGKEPDYAGNAKYMTVTVVGEEFYFTDDEGKTYFPSDVSRFKYLTEYEDEDENVVSKDGNRVIVAFNFLDAPVSGFDYNIALYNVSDILNLDVKAIGSDEDVDEVYGDNPVTILDAVLNGVWLDTYCGLMSIDGAKYEITLIDNQPTDLPEDMPADYQYLELRLILDEDGSPNVPLEGYISFNLDTYAPSVTGKKGLYIRYKNAYGTVQYKEIEYKAQNNTATMSLDMKTSFDIESGL
jgi:hypothetical protein